MLAATLLSGCSVAPRQELWIDDRGGVIQDASHERLIAACQQKLLDPLQLKVRLYVLDSDALTAYAWPDGSIYLTRGLIDSISDRELLAAVAHEIGHLLDDKQLGVVWSLRGPDLAAFDIESRADLIGCRLLRSQGIEPTVMISLLKKIQGWKGLPDRNRKQIEQRIAVISAIPLNNAPPTTH